MSRGTTSETSSSQKFAEFRLRNQCRRRNSLSSVSSKSCRLRNSLISEASRTLAPPNTPDKLSPTTNRRLKNCPRNHASSGQDQLHEPLPSQLELRETKRKRNGPLNGCGRRIVQTRPYYLRKHLPANRRLTDENKPGP